jgi:hypothetical protein
VGLGFDSGAAGFGGAFVEESAVRTGLNDERRTANRQIWRHEGRVGSHGRKMSRCQARQAPMKEM